LLVIVSGDFLLFSHIHGLFEFLVGSTPT
jgi:hypothetical protein